jgi:hypothetical protein
LAARLTRRPEPRPNGIPRGDPHDARSAGRWLFGAPAAAFALAAILAGVVRSQHPFDHGWWLVAYLALVGALSQLILGAGQQTFAADLPRPSLSGRTVGAELALWNAGAVIVPVGVFVETPRVVAAGSVLLHAALALFAAATDISEARRARDHGVSLYVYRVAVILLAASVLVGTGLADALPWQ